MAYFQLILGLMTSFFGLLCEAGWSGFTKLVIHNCKAVPLIHKMRDPDHPLSEVRWSSIVKRVIQIIHFVKRLLQMIFFLKSYDPASGSHIIIAQIYVWPPLFNDKTCVAPPPEHQIKCYPPSKNVPPILYNIGATSLSILPPFSNCPTPFIFPFDRPYPHCWVNRYVTSHTTPHVKDFKFPLPVWLIFETFFKISKTY